MAEMSKAAADVLAERRRQVDGEGFTAEHDDEHHIGEMAMAAACYAVPDLIFVEDRRANAVIYKDPWPWDDRWDKRKFNGNVVLPNKRAARKDRRRQLVIAGALIIAEIERLDRRPDEHRVPRNPPLPKLTRPPGAAIVDRPPPAAPEEPRTVARKQIVRGEV